MHVCLNKLLDVPYWKKTTFMKNLGLDGVGIENPVWQEPINANDPGWTAEWIDEYEKEEYKSTIKTLIGWGAKFEDEEFGKRPLNHFFDPLDGRPIHPCPPFSDCNTSPDWALEDSMLQPNLSRQHDSLIAVEKIIDGTDRVFLIQILRDAHGAWRVEGM